MNFPKLSETQRIHRLQPPTGRVQMVLDTDTYNEIDDQFAVVHALLSPNEMDVKAIYAAPFHNNRSTSPEDGMEKSYTEIHRLLTFLNIDPNTLAYRGAPAFLPNRETAVPSDAATDLIERALATQDEPLYVTAIGAITNVATAILLAPEIINKIVVIWLGGNPLYWPHTREFNLTQDLPSAQVVLDCGVPFVWLPARGVVSHLHTTLPEMERHVQGRGKVGDYLTQIFKDYTTDPFGWSKVIWDLSATAYLVNPTWVPTDIVHSPILTEGATWSFDNSRHLMRVATSVNRDAIFRDLFTKLQNHTL